MTTSDTTTTTTNDNVVVVEMAPMAPEELQPLLEAAANATRLKAQATATGAHDSFRYEWGTWVVDTALEHLMERVNEIRLKSGIYSAAYGNDDQSSHQPAQRWKLATGPYWDVWLHLLPPNTVWRGQWPTGSWSIVKPLTGLVEIAALRRSAGKFVSTTTKQLRGGGDGSLAGSSSSAGVDCIKYVGGPLRSYTGVGGQTVLLEVVIRPPIGDNENMDAVVVSTDSDESSTEQQPIVAANKDIGDVLTVYIPPPETDNDDEEDDEITDDDDSNDNNNKHLGAAMGMKFDKVGGLDKQLDDIARRVLASRANPAAARRLGVSHVRGILLSGPPGCGKTLLARELADLLGAREPQIVDGPSILSRFIGEAEKNVRELFEPAEREYKEAGDDSALHIIILDEMDAIAKKRGSMTSDTTGVRDSVVNQLLAKMDGVRQASNVLVVGMTNRPELLDPALLRPGRFEVQLRVELPDLSGRRDILRIHTRRMRQASGVTADAIEWMDDLTETGLPAATEYFTGAELAGLVRSAASFALARSVESQVLGTADADEEKNDGDSTQKTDREDQQGAITAADLKQALSEVRPALGKQDEVLKMRYPHGISPCSSAIKRVLRDLGRFVAPPAAMMASSTPGAATSSRFQSLLLVGAGGKGGAGATALAAYAAADASSSGTDYVRFITALDLLSGEGGGSDEARAAALVEKFAEAREMPDSLLVLDDVDQLCAGSGPSGYSSVMLATLRALLRSPPVSTATAKAGGHSESQRRRGGRSISIIAATSRSDAACDTLYELFDETIVVPLLSEPSSVQQLLQDSLLAPCIANTQAMSELIIDRLGSVGCKTALRIAERAIGTASRLTTADDDPSHADTDDTEDTQLAALGFILDDLAGDQAMTMETCTIR